MGAQSVPIPGERSIDYALWTAAQPLSGPGALNNTSRTALLNATGVGQVVTLADGRYVGQRKTIVAFSGYGGGNTTVLTPLHATGFATITFNADGQVAELEWGGAAWFIVYTLGGPIVA